MYKRYALSIHAGWLAALMLAGSLLAGCSAQSGYSDAASPLQVTPSAVVYEPSAALDESQSASAAQADPAPIREYYLNDGRIGWKIEARTDVTSGVHNRLYRTENGGAQWVKIDDSRTGSFPAGAVGAVRFTDDVQGWVAVDAAQTGDPGLYGTTDGGVSWSRTPLQVPADFADARFEPKTPIRFEGTPLGLFIAQTDGAAGSPETNPLLFYVTSDGGATWSDPIRGEAGELAGLRWQTERLSDGTGRSWSVTIDGRTWTFERSDK